MLKFRKIPKQIVKPSILQKNPKQIGTYLFFLPAEYSRWKNGKYIALDGIIFQEKNPIHNFYLEYVILLDTAPTNFQFIISG